MTDLTEAAGTRQGTSSGPRRGLLAKLSEGVARVYAQVRDTARSVIKSLVPRAVDWLRAKLRPSIGSIKALFMATIGKDRGFGFWWLVTMLAIALVIGLLVAVLLSPVIGLVAALVVAIAMLVRRSRSTRSRGAEAGLAR
ncbi:MAG TPA: hypothetical protein VF838_20035 [Trebonia sp.]